MNTKYKIGQTVYYMNDNQIIGRPIIQINISQDEINYCAGGRWFLESDLFIDIDSLLKSLVDGADIQ